MQWLDLKVGCRDSSPNNDNQVDVYSILTHLPLDKMAASLADDIFKCIFLNENDRIPIQIPLQFVPGTWFDNTPALVQVIAWRRTGDKPLPEPMMTWFIDAYMRHKGEWVNVSVSPVP